MPDATGPGADRPGAARRATRTRCWTPSYFRDKAALTVAAGSIRETLAHLRGKGFNFLASVHGVDYWPEEPRFGVHYELLDMHEVDRMTVKVRVPLDAPNVPSVVADWPTADHQEREIYDMFGVVFDGHPDLRRILMPEDYVGHPAAARLPARRRGRALHAQRAATPGVVEVMSDVTQQAGPVGDRGHELPRDGVRASSSQHLEHPEHDELLTLNLGPHHPATHGVLRLITTLEGEVVRDIKPVIGYVHTGIEKNCEDKAYWKVIPLVERMDYLSYYFNAMAFCGSVETLLDIEVPKRAQYLRVIHMELNRIASHLLWLATGGLDLGAMSVFWYALARARPDPRPVRDVLRPAHAPALLPGRRRRRGHPDRLRGARRARSPRSSRSASTSSRR